MTSNKFFLQLFVCIIVLVSIYSLWGQFSSYIAEYTFLYSGLVFLLTFISIGSFFLAKKATTSHNIHHFTKVFLASTSIKMGASVVFLLIYLNRYPADPDDRTFILPFLLIYLGFTIFEVQFLSQLGKVVHLQPEDDNFIDYTALEEAAAEDTAAQKAPDKKDDDEENPPFEPPTLSPFQK